MSIGARHEDRSDELEFHLRAHAVGIFCRCLRICKQTDVVGYADDGEYLVSLHGTVPGQWARKAPAHRPLAVLYPCRSRITEPTE